MTTVDDVLVPKEGTPLEETAENHDHQMWDAISDVVSPRCRRWLRWPDRYRVLPDAEISTPE